MDYIWIILLVLSAILIASYGKKVSKAEHPNACEKEGRKGKKSKKAKKAKKAKKQKAQKPLRENRMLEFSMAGLFIGIVASFVLTDKVALLLSGCFFAGLVLGMIFRKKTYVESLDELDIEEDYTPDFEAEENAEAETADEFTFEPFSVDFDAEEPEAEIITAE